MGRKKRLFFQYKIRGKIPKKWERKYARLLDKVKGFLTLSEDLDENNNIEENRKEEPKVELKTKTSKRKTTRKPRTSNSKSTNKKTTSATTSRRKKTTSVETKQNA